MTDLIKMGQDAKLAQRKLAKMSSLKKDEALRAAADAIEAHEELIIEANEIDYKLAQELGVKAGNLDRLKLDKKRVKAMALGLRQLSSLDDPIGKVDRMWKRPNELRIGQVRVPIGLIGIIYESRPNVTSDAFGICFKTGNACILRGGSDSINSSKTIVKVIKDALESVGCDSNCLQIIEDTDRKYVTEMLSLKEYIDLIIPRGSDRLINHVVDNSCVPVIRTGTGNCHIFVDETADFTQAVDIIENAKTQRIGVCNACEALVIHSSVVKEVIPLIADRLEKHNVEMRGDKRACDADSRIIPAVDEDWGKEYLDYIISIKTVDSLDEAIDHINKYSTGHSESILSKDYENVERFLNEIDAACVYANASTRFTDGEEFGFGAEIGISTQKIHARGPMGLEQMTSTKYIIYGNGQFR